MKNIKILDCTLRDGGYVNNWEFSKTQAQNIINKLICAKIDYIEIGYILDKEKEDNKTLFSDFESIKEFIPNTNSNTKLCAMINYGELDINNVPLAKDSCIKYLRLIFKKHQIDAALNYAKELINKGYKVFINPMSIHTYSDNELKELIIKINEIKPFAYTIMDSFGVLYENEVIDKYNIIKSILNKEIVLCFHSHNNLQLSFTNARMLIECCTNRELIIDASVYGIGRGAGNLCIELLIDYLNKAKGTQYKLIPIIKIIDEEINKIYEKEPWGYSFPYYQSAINYCHPNYAKFFIDKKELNNEVINKIFKLIPSENKSIYNKELITKLYRDIIINKK